MLEDDSRDQPADLFIGKDRSKRWKVEMFDEVDSTNTRIKAAIAQGAPEGTCIAARKQTSAYGRQGRSWSSPDGGLYFSFILDPLGAHANRPRSIGDLPSVSLVLSLGVHGALEAFVNDPAIRIKWPNDIVLVQGQGYAKLCGISLEVVAGKLCCGVGINVFRPSALQDHSLSDQQRYERAYLDDRGSMLTGQRDQQEALTYLLACSLRSIASVYDRWIDGGIAPLIEGYDALLFNRGCFVTLETVGGQAIIEGVVIGVDEQGRLILETPRGQRVQVASGEVHTRS